MTARLISVDWGTTSLRCALVADGGAVIEHVRVERGILKTVGEAFGDILFSQIAPWLAQFPESATVPVMLSGMIGSRQGWQEAAYLRCPASPHDLAKSLTKIETAGTPLETCDVRIIPGMDIAGDELGVLPDVMRGEETQVLGALIGASQSDGTFVLPGTHSKWVVVRNQTITEFQTFMTGETYAALLGSTILGKLAEGDVDDVEAFGLGVNTAVRADNSAGPGQLLNLVFSARSRVLFGELEPTAVRSYLSGLLIGAEITSARKLGNTVSEGEGKTETGFVLAEEALRARYITAGGLAGLKLKWAADNPVPIAHLAIARLAGIVP